MLRTQGWGEWSVCVWVDPSELSRESSHGATSQQYSSHFLPSLSRTFLQEIKKSLPSLVPQPPFSSLTRHEIHTPWREIGGGGGWVAVRRTARTPGKGRGGMILSPPVVEATPSPPRPHAHAGTLARRHLSRSQRSSLARRRSTPLWRGGEAQPPYHTFKYSLSKGRREMSVCVVM